MAAVDRRALGGLERAAAEHAHRHRHPRRARGRGADVAEATDPSAGPSPGPTAPGTCGPGTGPSSPSCSAWRARSSRSPRRCCSSMSLLVTSSQRHAKHLPRSAPIAGGRRPPRRALVTGARDGLAQRVLGGCERWSPNPSAWAAASPAIRPESAAASRDSAPTTSPAAGDVLGRVGEREVPARLVVARLCAGLQQQRARRGSRRPRRRSGRTRRCAPCAAVDGTEHRLADRLACPRASMIVWRDRTSIPSWRERLRLRARARPQVGDGVQPTPFARCSASAASSPRSEVVAITARVPGCDGVQRGQPPHAAGEHHAGQVVAGEHQRLLDRAGRQRRAGGRGPGAACRPARPGRARRRSRARSRARGSRTRLARSLLTSVRTSSATASTSAGRPARAPRRRAPRQRRAAAAAAAALSPAAPPPTTSTSAWRRRYSVRHSRSGCSSQPAQTGGVAQHLLVQRPQPPRADERLVVEAGRGERACRQVGHAHRVELERRATR